MVFKRPMHVLRIYVNFKWIPFTDVEDTWTSDSDCCWRGDTYRGLVTELVTKTHKFTGSKQRGVIVTWKLVNSTFIQWLHSKIFKMLQFWLRASIFWQIINNMNKIRDLFKVKLYIIRSETKKREREREKRKKRERETLNIY